MHKVGAEWNIAMAVFDYPEVEQFNNDEEVKNIFDVFWNNHENFHDYHEVLNDTISSVSIGQLPRIGWMVNITSLLKGDRRFKHVTSKLLRNLILTQLFVVGSKIISTD